MSFLIKDENVLKKGFDKKNPSLVKSQHILAKTQGRKKHPK